HPLMKQLFTYLAKDKEQLLIKSCVFHYELEFIHPFTDGNGRMGRLWQTVILKDKYPVFKFLPLESIIKEKQQKYYEALSRSDKAENSTFFVEFMLGIIEEALSSVLHSQNVTLTSSDRLSNAFGIFGKKNFTRKDYLRHFKHISPATASRDLKEGVENKLLEMSGDKRTAVYRFRPSLTKRSGSVSV
ncbi:MAG TPA: Fic family protein, partial [Bacteroidia bacterium]|nr:Fic family protein [Bacteroidia bacterium]